MARLLVVLAALAAAPALGQSADSTGCLAGSCRDGPGTYRYADGVVVTATFAGGVPVGAVTYGYPSGDLYTGTVDARKPHGRGHHTFAGGATWDGTWERGFGLDGTLTGADGRVLLRGPYPGRWAGERGFRCASGTCTTGEGAGVWPDSTRYTGRWRDGFRHGAGTTTYPSRDVVTGVRDRGALGGAGRIAYANGGAYDGTFRAGMRHGTGTYTDPAGLVIRAGEWRDDFHTGRGRIVFPDLGERYEGDIDGGYAQGRGVLTLADSSRYDGAFAQGDFDGEGTMTYADGAVYVGAWRAGQRDGAGTYTRPDGSGFAGTFARDRRSEGTYRFATGATWAGRWTDGAGDGDGRYADPAGAALDAAPFDELWTPGTPASGTTAGCLRGDCVDGEGTFRWSDGTLYTGGFARGLRHGPGVHANALGTVFEATFRDGLVEGRGRISYGNRDAYEGDLTADGRRVGQGRLRYADGTAYDGAWRDGHPNGAGVMTQDDGCHHTGTFATTDGRATIVAGTFACPDGTAYRGGWRGGEPDADGVWTFANGVSWTGRFDAGRGAGDGDWADAAGVVYARAPYANTARAGAAATTARVPVVGRVRVTTENTPGRRGVTVSAGNPDLERFLPFRP